MGVRTLDSSGPLQVQHPLEEKRRTMGKEIDGKQQWAPADLSGRLSCTAASASTTRAAHFARASDNGLERSATRYQSEPDLWVHSRGMVSLHGRSAVIRRMVPPPSPMIAHRASATRLTGKYRAAPHASSLLPRSRARARCGLEAFAPGHAAHVLASR